MTESIDRTGPAVAAYLDARERLVAAMRADWKAGISGNVIADRAVGAYDRDVVQRILGLESLTEMICRALEEDGLSIEGPEPLLKLTMTTTGQAFLELTARPAGFAQDAELDLVRRVESTLEIAELNLVPPPRDPVKEEIGFGIREVQRYRYGPRMDEPLRSADPRRKGDWA
ncbi:hypothetical protein [Streptomyces sp. NRRL S-350]|uniref:hypothetical protein n=1 Tax=Streptomyces sp. NRRL S-350 TaxID=1463902 RepID=UPI0004BED2D0|nr:hypothetical protein [Streptomyces sp. NRRL S-350]